MEYPELSYKDLIRRCDIEKLIFETTEEVPSVQGIIGQKRAEEAMEFGLEVDNQNYNIYISGSKGTGRTSYARNVVEKVAKHKPVPYDWCYVYDFDQQGRAVALNLPAGMGKIFQKEMEELIEDIRIQVPRAFNSEDYDRQKNEIIKEFQERKNKMLQYLNQYAKEKQFIMKSTSTGFIFTPLKEGDEMTEEEIQQLDEETKLKLEKQLEEIHEAALEILIKVKHIERLAKKKLLQLEMKVGLFVVKPLIDDLKDKYKQCQKVVNYLEKVEKDIVENIYQFVGEEEGEVFHLAQRRQNEGFLKKYKVNLFVDHSETQGAPVVMEFNPTLSKLNGKIEYENVNGVLRTDFMLARPGAIHLANGGYLILDAKQLLMNPYSWETLKRILQTKEITVENIGNQLGIMDVSSLKFEAIPVHLKVIIIGSEYVYHLLYYYDEDFEKYFKILVNFDEDMEWNDENEWKMIQFISRYTKQNGLNSFDKTGVARLIEYSSRLASSQKKLSTRFNKIVEIIIEANQWARLEKSNIVTGEHVVKAIHNKWYRLNKYEERIEEMFETRKMLIDVKGKKIGVVNGLSVINTGEYVFGKPNVITVTTSIGRDGIINIEREVNLSGNVYDKGVMILTGFLMEKFGQHKNIHLTARICFEQSYGEVDGDSASSAELYGLLSSLSGIPIRQYIAVTGSMNQKGYIQPVGGVTEKIEGFYELCKKRGFTQNQGVIIPYQNLENLMLKDEVIEAVKNGLFHIYPIRHVNEGIEIIIGEPCEKVYQLVDEKLDYYHDLEEINKIKI